MRKVGPFGWLQDNFTALVNATGIIGGLLFTAFSFRADASGRRLSNLIALTQAHREIWFRLYDEPSLARILEAELDLTKSPPSLTEVVFVTSLVLHLNCIHRATSLGMLPDLEGLRTDIRQFYSLPIPREVWNKLKPLQDLQFISFVEDCFARPGPL